MPGATVTSITSTRPAVLEFFAGIGLARLGLELAGFAVAWSNDYEPDKAAMYRAHFGEESNESGHTYHVGDVFQVDVSTLPPAELAWSSSPCTDLSLAGSRGGIRSGESNAFWGFIEKLGALGKLRPRTVVLENVLGLASSHGGDDLTAAIRAFNELGYSVDVLSIDARRFVPQSRPRLFVIATVVPVDEETGDHELRPAALSWVFADPTLKTHRAKLPTAPAIRTDGFSQLVETMEPADHRWWDEGRTSAFLNSLSPVQTTRLLALVGSSTINFRTAYRRTRNGVATWEIRADDVSGCLRTARGGSSKQAVVSVGRGEVRVRWMTPVEYSRLMGAGDYKLHGARTNQALFAFGDAVAVPAVEWLARNYLMPLARHTDSQVVESRANAS